MDITLQYVDGCPNWHSPTMLIDGIDPFADPDAPAGLSYRVYRTDAGLAGSPTVEQLLAALR